MLEIVKKIALIVPVCNEEKTIPIFIDTLSKINLPIGYDIIFVDDGSSDNTLNTIKKMTILYKNIHFISFSRNFGKEGGLLAGLKAAINYKYVAVMDVDLQDPPELLPKMLEIIQEKNIDVVATRRSNRKDEPFFRSVFSNGFYSLINKLSQTKLVPGERDFRLMKNNVVKAIISLPENQRFSKGIFSWIGFKKEYISYENVDRSAGRSSWSFLDLCKYAVNGIVSFSTFPLTIITFIGIICFFLSIVAAFIVITRYILGIPSAFGWSSMIVIVLFFSGVQLLSLGVLGKYISSTYLETKKRPYYIIRDTDLN
ncbi:putative bactoprenol glycosyl transferase, phage origin (csbB) [Oenococcus oeni]|uniref:glycosyltransferase family 2 protein n=1 Tax=Oenococcus oeni TaxID=1247 RepID=UPI00107D45E0|nr:glycosyltransferase family 2 protein [Oenococcus oeni]AVI93422.1 bactoprenol glucosyl transferase [Oenococcus oeni]SYV98418.1 putative bactoprenol glycosyl transferase, phage origin (csbB) [Oenococcus oeni]SYW03670.1 putative bactoprenol glycosyl transferase, phage origin (csbB) [Oenococcus oeni]SYW18877.1 putative bactoprenol glycosyl transferase, phage origin (csbB) [Oenococcus oeni]VDC13820.1 putative bactoprenol glycosyl transferase, phage origin (csbB) [Oenococcus oeni]